MGLVYYSLWLYFFSSRHLYLSLNINFPLREFLKLANVFLFTVARSRYITRSLSCRSTSKLQDFRVTSRVQRSVSRNIAYTDTERTCLSNKYKYVLMYVIIYTIVAFISMLKANQMDKLYLVN